MRSIIDIFRSYGILDECGRHTNGTDKETNHRYGHAYEAILKGRRESAQLIMEIGIADGSSLLAWREIFPHAHCVGMDIHPAAMLHPLRLLGDPSRIEVCIGDQRVKEDCEQAAAGRQFDIIVEDATHELDATLRTLLFLWPHVKKGGLYIIEEFANIGALRQNVLQLFKNAEIIDTTGPSGGVEPLVVLRKPR